MTKKFYLTIFVIVIAVVIGVGVYFVGEQKSGAVIPSPATTIATTTNTATATTTELGHNGNYVFALPARYNYTFPDGWQEVDTIMHNNPLHAF